MKEAQTISLITGTAECATPQCSGELNGKYLVHFPIAQKQLVFCENCMKLMVKVAELVIITQKSKAI